MTIPFRQSPEIPSSILDFRIVQDIDALLSHMAKPFINGIVNSVTGLEPNGSSYLVGNSPTGIFTGLEGWIVFRIKGGWYKYKPLRGDKFYRTERNNFILFTFESTADYRTILAPQVTTFTTNSVAFTDTMVRGSSTISLVSPLYFFVGTFTVVNNFSTTLTVDRINSVVVPANTTVNLFATNTATILVS